MNPKRRGKEMIKVKADRKENADWLKREECCKQAWFAYIKTHALPAGIPTRPDLVYAGVGWKGWQDWIGLADSKGKGGLQ